MDTQHIDTVLAASGAKATQVGATTSVVSWMLSSQFGVLVGIVVGLVGLSVNWYYRHKQDRREQREHEARMDALRE